MGNIVFDPDRPPVRRSFSTGGGLGAFAEFDLSPTLALQARGMFVQKGVNLSGTLGDGVRGGYFDADYIGLPPRSRFVNFTKHFAIPMWFDEGTATLIQTRAPFKDRFQSYLERRPQLFSVRQLRYATDWETMSSVEGGILTGQHYGYVGTFADYLRQVYGTEYVPLPRVGRVTIKWSIILALLMFFGLWVFRQVCRMVRFAAARVR